MPVSLKEATDKAKYVEWINDYAFAVWHGGHTVNFYSLTPEMKVRPTNSISVGSFEKESATIQEVKEALKKYRD